MQKYLERLLSYSDEIIKPVDSLKKFFTWTVMVFSVGIGVGAWYSSYLSSGTHQLSGTGPLISPGPDCDISMAMENARRTYADQIEPVIESWIRLNDEASNPDLLPTQMEAKKETAETVRQEIQRMQIQHEGFIREISLKCDDYAQ